MGDSRTDGDAWVLTLLQSLPPIYWWKESPSRYAGAWGIANLESYVNANLANEPIQSKYVLLNIGSNDLDDSPVEAIWKASMLSILNSILIWSPDAKVYISKPWRQGYDTEADTMAGWIDDIIVLQSNAYLADDERVWFKPDVATLSDDGIHYNAAGQAEKVNQMKAVLGY